MASLGEILTGLAEINSQLEGTTIEDYISLTSDEGWRDKVQDWFEKVRGFAKEMGFKGFSIEAAASISPKIGITLDFEFKKGE